MCVSLLLLVEMAALSPEKEYHSLSPPAGWKLRVPLAYTLT